MLFEGQSMVKIRDNKYGKITNVEKRYADVLVKLGKHSLVVEPASVTVLKPVVKPAAAVQTPESKASAWTPPRMVEAVAEQPRPVQAMSTRQMKPVQPDDDDETEISERTGKPKRSYTRRDMVAED